MLTIHWLGYLGSLLGSGILGAALARDRRDRPRRDRPHVTRSYDQPSPFTPGSIAAENSRAGEYLRRRLDNGEGDDR